MAELWSFEELVRAANGTSDGPASAAITGFSIDTRALQSGEVFVALKDQRDGHEFVTSAFKAGAAAAIVAGGYERKPGDGALIRVDDTLKALERIGRAARARLAPEARVLAVTGSAGKTTTKEMMRVCLSRVAPGRVHASDKSFNNHWGVPLTLARMPRDTRFAVFEIGMNHPGEITPLSRMVRPHAAMITMVGAVHLAQFNSVEEIAEAKAEIIAGLEPGGFAVLNADNEHVVRTIAPIARSAGVNVAWFGSDPSLSAVTSQAKAAGTHARLVSYRLDADGTDIECEVGGELVAFRLGVAGAHMVLNALGALLAMTLSGIRPAEVAPAFLEFAAPKGRGSRIELKVGAGEALLVDESYNANPNSMRAAIAALASIPRSRCPRRVAVLGDMLELGPESARLHAALAPDLEAAGVDIVFASGPMMRTLFEALKPALRGLWTETSAALKEPLLGAAQAGDVILIKGSNGSRMQPLVEALQKQYAGPSTGS